jgi:hypothetical protein
VLITGNAAPQVVSQRDRSSASASHHSNGPARGNLFASTTPMPRALAASKKGMVASLAVVSTTIASPGRSAGSALSGSPARRSPPRFAFDQAKQVLIGQPSQLNQRRRAVRNPHNSETQPIALGMARAGGHDLVYQRAPHAPQPQKKQRLLSKAAVMMRGEYNSTRVLSHPSTSQSCFPSSFSGSNQA